MISKWLRFYFSIEREEEEHPKKGLHTLSFQLVLLGKFALTRSIVF